MGEIFRCVFERAIRESVNGTTHVAPHLMVFGSLPRGPLTILKETWLGQRDLIDPKSKSIQKTLQFLIHTV